MSLVHVLIFAFLFGARDSTGVVLPMLLIRRRRCGHALPPARALGLRAPHAAAGVQRRSYRCPPDAPAKDNAAFKPTIGWIVLSLTVLQVTRNYRPEWFGNIPHSPWFAWTIGLLAGMTTMLANAAGPIFAISFLAVGLPKFEFVGTFA